MPFSVSLLFAVSGGRIYPAPERMSVPSPEQGFSAPTLAGTCTRRCLAMVTTCANPPCGARLRYLSVGRLFRLEVEYGKREYFWLCADCASKVVLMVKAGHGVVVVPRAISDLSGAALTSLHRNASAASSPTTNVFLAIDCPNRSCRRRIFLARAGERYSSEKPDLPLSFKIVCPKCGERQTVRRRGTYVIEVENPTAVTFADILYSACWQSTPRS